MESLRCHLPTDMYPGPLKLDALQMSQDCWNVGSFKLPIFPVESFPVSKVCTKGMLLNVA